MQKQTTRLTLTLLTDLLVTLTILGCHRTQSHHTEASNEVIGVYDSRAVAVAFVGSEAFNEWMASLQSEHDAATAAGDKSRIAEIEAEGKRRQEQLHQQAFGTEPVDDLLVYITDEMAVIKDEIGATSLVSKWDADTLSGYPNTNQDDVTLRLVDAFEPTPRQRESAIQIIDVEPVK